MRLGEWRKAAPNKESMSNGVLAVLRPVLVDLGADTDPDCWVAWGDDPETRYSVLAPTAAGLITVAVRVVGAEGPRATAKLVRWSKVSISELGIESVGGHRIVAVQVESLVLKGNDVEADRICEFVRGLIAGVDGRNQTLVPVGVMPGVALGRAGVVAPASAAAAAGLGRAEAAEPATAKAAKRPAPAAPETKAAAAAPKITPAAKAVAKAAPKPAEKPAALALVPPSKPAQPAQPAAPAVPPTPIAARAAAAHHADQPPTSGRPAPAAPEPEPDRSEWIGPHPIEETSSREPAKPRPWKP
jgi:hypothetical protein